MSGVAPIEAHVLLDDFHRKPYAKYATLHEERQSWPIHTKPVFKTTLGTSGHDKTYDKDYVSEMVPARGTGEPQYTIKDIEGEMMGENHGDLRQGGFRHDDPTISVFTSKQIHMDVDLLQYL